MKSVLLTIILCLFLYEVLASSSLEEQWKQYKIQFNRKYESTRDENRKYRAFKTNLKEINRHNRRFKRGKETFEKGITIFADLTEKQFNKKYGFTRPALIKVYEDKKRSVSKNDTTNFDWREKGAVTHVKEQGICGSCWIFSAIGVLEGYNFRKTGKLISLSEQNVVDCFQRHVKTCKGGFPGHAIMYVQKNGVSKEADYPYKEKQRKCRSHAKKIKIDFKEYKFLNVTEEGLKDSLEKYGPLGISMYATGGWRLYKRGVWFDKKCSEMTNHALVLVGYGTENGHDYWLIKNSWGRLWGEDGYFKVARNRHENYCGLTNEAMYIVE